MTVKTGVTLYLWWTFHQWKAPKGNSAFKCTTDNASLELNVYNNNNLYTCIPSVTALAMRLCLLTIRLSSYREGEIQGWFLLQILLFKNKTVLESSTYIYMYTCSGVVHKIVPVIWSVHGETSLCKCEQDHVLFCNSAFTIDNIHNNSTVLTLKDAAWSAKLMRITQKWKMKMSVLP